MSDKDRTPMEEAALALYFHVAQRIKEGKSHEEIITELQENGVSRKNAERLLERLDESRDNVTRRSGYRNLVLGGLLTVIIVLALLGVVGTPLTGIALVIAYGLLGLGLIIFIRGLLQILRV